VYTSTDVVYGGQRMISWGSTTEDGHCVILSKRQRTDRKEDTTVAAINSMDLGPARSRTARHAQALMCSVAW